MRGSNVWFTRSVGLESQQKPPVSADLEPAPFVFRLPTHLDGNRKSGFEQIGSVNRDGFNLLECLKSVIADNAFARSFSNPYAGDTGGLGYRRQIAKFIRDKS